MATRETDLWLPLEHQAGHLLLVGTTGSFKTQALILLISQAILRGEAVLVIDPKGDRALWRAMQAACHRTGRPQAAHYFHPAFPERSIRLDPLRNFANPTELASRVAALIPSETGLDLWKAFGWKTVNDIVAGLLVVDERPNLVNIRRYVEGGAERLLRRALQRYSDRLAVLVKATPPPIDAELSVHIQVYQTVLAPGYPSLGLDGLMALARHNREHFGKMVASLIPVLAMLTAPPLDALLSPGPQEASDPRPLTDLARLLDTQQAVYIGLDTLPNATVGSAIGSLLLADLTASLGARYNYRDRFTPITVVVDEAAEVLNEPFIQLLNKGRGAGARAILATQTLGDFEARLASPARARQVLGNVNNRLIGRVLDPETQRYLADGLPKTRLRRLIAAQGDTADSTQPLAFSGGYSETLQEEEAPLFAPEWLGLLPNLQYIALLSGHRIVKGRLPILALPATPAPETPVT